MAERLRIRFFVDHCVPDSVGRVLRDAGHEVMLLRERIAADSPDPLVAAVSEMYGAVLVSHDKDYKALAPRVAIGERQRFRRLSRIALTCSEPQAANRINEALSLIEHEWSAAQGRSDKRILVEIGMSFIRTIR
jgi:predicted nuclease of predicted toxin-antitoxin system